jgi:hypothetical protein
MRQYLAIQYKTNERSALQLLGGTMCGARRLRAWPRQSWRWRPVLTGLLFDIDDQHMKHIRSVAPLGLEGEYGNRED